MKLFRAFFVIFLVFGLNECHPLEDFISKALNDYGMTKCLKSVKITNDVLLFLNAIHVSCSLDSQRTSSDPLCKFAADHAAVEPVDLEEPISDPESEKIFDFARSSQPTSTPVYLNIYNLLDTNPIVKLLSCVKPVDHLNGLFHTSISFMEKEYYYGTKGLTIEPDRMTSFGPKRFQKILGYENCTSDTFQSYAEVIAIGNHFTSQNYHLFDHNCNDFTNQASLALYDKPIPAEIKKSVDLVANSTLGTLIRQATHFVQL